MTTMRSVDDAGTVTGRCATWNRGRHAPVQDAPVVVGCALTRTSMLVPKKGPNRTGDELVNARSGCALTHPARSVGGDATAPSARGRKTRGRSRMPNAAPGRPGRARRTSPGATTPAVQPEGR